MITKELSHRRRKVVYNYCSSFMHDKLENFVNGAHTMALSVSERVMMHRLIFPPHHRIKLCPKNIQGWQN